MFENALIRAPKSTVFGPRDPFHGLFDRVFNDLWNDSDYVADGEAGRRTWSSRPSSTRRSASSW